MFLTPYGEDCLIPDALQTMQFGTCHADFYNDVIRELSANLNLTEPQMVQVALNATAKAFFTLPTMPKSWHFQVSQTIVFSRKGKLCQLVNNQGESGLVLVVEADQDASVVMLLSQNLALSEYKQLECFQTIKVMNDRLSPLPAAASHRISAA